MKQTNFVGMELMLCLLLAMLEMNAIEILHIKYGLNKIINKVSVLMTKWPNLSHPYPRELSKALFKVITILFPISL